MTSNLDTEEPLLVKVRADSLFGPTYSNQPSLTLARLHPGPEPEIAPPPPQTKSGKELTTGIKPCVAQVPAILVAVLMTMVNAVTYGTLCFKGIGSAASSMPNGITIWLLGTLLAQAAVIGASRLPAGLGCPTVEMIPVLHSFYKRVALSFPDDVDPDIVAGTCIATTVVATFSLGVLLVLCSHFRASRWLRTAPVVVLKGAIFGVSLFLLQSGVETAAPKGSWTETWPLWSTAVGLGSALFFINEITKSAILVAGLLAFIATIPTVLTLLGVTSLEELRAGGWLLPAPPHGEEPHSWYQELLTTYMTILPQVSWSVVASQVPALAGIWLAHALCCLMDLKAIEFMTKRDLDVDSELRAIGFGNIISSMTGSCWPVYILCSQNVTCYKLGGKTSLVGYMVMVGTIGALFVAQSIVPRLPCALPASVAWWLGISFAQETIIDVFFKNTKKLDIMIVGAMGVVMVLYGLLQALLFGFLLAVALFTVQYSGSRSAVVRAVGDARLFRSNVSRSLEQRRLLEQFGHQIAVVHVDGYLMFGSSPQLTDSVHQLLNVDALRWIVLSFRGVRGVDYSAIMDLVSLGRRASEAGVTILLTDLRDSVKATLDRAGLDLPILSSMRGRRDAPLGLMSVEHYNTALLVSEDAILASAGFPTALDSRESGEAGENDSESAALSVLVDTFGTHLREGNVTLATFRSYFELVEYTSGSIIWKAGEVGSICVGVVEGELHAFVSRADGSGDLMLLETVPVGSFVGFNGMLHHFPYVHTVVVPETCPSCKVLQLSWQKFSDMRAKQQFLELVILRAFMQRNAHEVRELIHLAYL